MDRFGSDKPDLRFGIELTELTSYFSDTPFRVFQAPYVGAVVMPGGGSQPRRAFDAWQDWAKSRGAKGLAYVTIAERRSEEHTSELQSHDNLACRLLLETKIPPPRPRRVVTRPCWRRALSASRRVTVDTLIFFFNDPAPAEIYPLSLRAALPI